MGDMIDRDAMLALLTPAPNAKNGLWANRMRKLLGQVAALPAAEPAETISILRTRVEDQATEIARLTRIVQMQPPAIKPAQTRLDRGMTDAELERLAMLAEECAEVIQVVGKIIRHGRDSYHPDSPNVTNERLLEKEIMDFQAVYLAMIRAGDVRSPGDLESSAAETWERKLRWTHHQRRAT